MARQILPIAGQIIGGMIGGPVGAAIGGALGSAIGQYVDPIRHQGPKLGEARAQTAQEGVYRPLVFGTGCVAGNVIHRSPRRVVVHREDASGKGNRDTVDSERGYRTFAIRIAEAHTPEGYQLLRIWENETLVYDVRPESEIQAESAEYAEKFRFYPGTQEQLPDPDLEAYLGVGNVNSYRGSCYIVFGNFDLTDYGDMVPQYRFEVASRSVVASPGTIIATGQTQTGVHRAAYSNDGANWSEAKPIPVSPAFAVAVDGGRFLVYNTHEAFYSDDFGESWTASEESFTGIGVTRSSSASGSSVLIPAGLNGIYRSGDRGESFSIKSGPQVSAPQHVTFLSDSHAVSYGQYSPNYNITIDSGNSWSTGGVSGLSVISGGSAAAHNGIAVFGGSVIAGAAVAFTGGLSERIDVLSSQPGDYVSALASNGNVLVAGTRFGSIYWLDDSGWNKSIYISTEQINQIAWNGVAFVAVGGGAVASQILYSGTGKDDWQIASQPLLSHATSVAAHLPKATVDGDRVSLASVLEFCHRRVGMMPTQYDVLEMLDMMDGVVFADGYTARDAITTLLPIYNADASEHDRGSGYRINYIKRGAPVVRTLTIDDLVDEPEETIREDPMERPRVLHMAFESPVTGYTAGKASIQRLSPDVKLVNEVSTYVPVTFKDVDEAWQRADVQMRVAWTEVHGERKFSIPDSHIDLVPTDNVALSLRGQAQRLRLQKNEYADGVMKLEAMADRQSNYTSHVTGIPLPAPERPPPSLMGPAALAILDIPAISDQHDRLGYYVAVCGTTEAYAGAVIQRQQNGEWADVVSLGRSQRAIMGVLENTVTAGSEHYTDTTNTVSLALYMNDELESLSDAQWLNKGGAFALETATGWEIMQYRDAYQDSGGVWHLTHLARGRLNTDADEHLPGARFVMLSGAQFIDADVGMIGQPLTLRAAAVGRSPETAVPETITYQGNSQREFPAASLSAELDGSTLELAAIPRDRFGTEQHPVRSANHDGFRWSATDGSSTVAADTDHATASLDVSGLSPPITATVAQLNRYTGAGPTVSELIE